MKNEHIRLGVEILDGLRMVDDAEHFLELCHLVDRFKELNYSKKRTITSKNVRQFLEQHNYLAPVETDPKRRESSSSGEFGMANTPAASLARRG